MKQLYHYEGDLIPRGKIWQTPFEFLWENAKDDRLKDASARDMWIIMEGLSVEEGIQIRSDFPDRIPLAKTFDQMILLVTESFLPKTSTRCSRDDYLQSHVTCMKPVADDKMLHLREVITSIANKRSLRDGRN